MLLALLATASAGDFMDVWVTSALQDGNVLAGPDAYSPAPNFVTRGTSTFFENYETRFVDDVSQSYLVLYRKDDGFHPNIFTEAAMVIRFNPYVSPNDSNPGVKIRDDGSYVRVGYKIGGDANHVFSFTGYAVDANRFRLGYSYDLTWGGRDIFAFDPNVAPGVRLQWQKGETYLFAGAKTALGDYTDPVTSLPLEQAYWGGLFGGGTVIADVLRAEFGAGSFQQGQLVNIEDVTSPLYAAPINAIGASAQLGFRTNKDMGWVSSSELRLMRNAPDFVKDSYISHRHVDGVGLLVQAEGNYLAHNLLDFDDADSTVIETAFAGDVQATLGAGNTEIGADFVYKDLTYILFNVPGLTSGYSMPDSYEVTPQIYGRLRASHHFPGPRLTPQLGVGLMQPATYGDAENGYYVVRDETDRSHVPTGQSPTALLSGVAGLQWDISKSMVAVGEVLYTIDNNVSDFVASDGGPGEFVPAPENWRNQLGVNVMVRARF
ncbi:MAG: hypothetical protein ACK4YP_01705 [Myxococcota bacterium]